jgi:GT2 family glycosyltransferase
VAQDNNPILISIVIVNYKVPEFLKETIRSVCEAQLYEKSEIIVVDNDSRDKSKEIITASFPNVIWIQMKSNVGFGKACNIGVRKAQGEYILLLNPDTVISKNTLSTSLEFLESHPDVGLMGPKILNSDGTLQESCHRSFPSPLDAFYHLSGISKLFPKNKRFGKYYLTYLDPDTSTQVDAVSGSFMFLKRSLYSQIGGFDERFFMYGEDMDICWRISDAGYKVWYYPGTQIIHRKGKSSSKVKIRSRIAFYEAMVLFSRKYQNRQKGFFPGWFIFVGIFIQASISIGGNLLKFITPAIIDLFIINFALWSSLTLRFSATTSPYESANPILMLMVHAILSSCFLGMFIYNGVYQKRQYTASKAFISGIMASVLFVAIIFFVSSLAFSRMAFGISAVAISIVLVFWREVIPQLIQALKLVLYSPTKVIIVGNGPVSELVIRDTEEHRYGKISGIVWTDSLGKKPGEYEGYPVLGNFADLKKILKKYPVDILLISTSHPWYSTIIDTLSSMKIKNLNIQWVPHEYFNLPIEQIPKPVPLRDFSV